MPIQFDVSLARKEDGSITIAMTPPTPLGGQEIKFQCSKRFGSDSPIFARYLSSGLNGASGITLLNSGVGIMRVDLWSSDTSGLDFGVYACSLDRLSSGMRTVLAEGYLTLTPSNG